MKFITESVKAFESNGFTLIRKSKHQIWLCPCGHRQIVSVSSGCGGRGSLNRDSLIRRTLRECAVLKQQAA